MKLSFPALYRIWGGMFALTACMGLAFPLPAGALGAVMKILTAGFFVPGWLILLKARTDNAPRHRAIVRCVCLASLGVTVVVLALNLMSANWSETVGNILHVILTIVSAPMVCGGMYILSLFLWGCLLMGAMSKPRR